MNEPRALGSKPSLAGFGLPNDAKDKENKDAQRDEARAKQKADAPRATADYQAAQQAVRNRTAALREARIAREKTGGKEPK